jgi:Flp pilus assembly pilin Flp
MNKESGVTLVEFAIVFVIIALLIVGILQGKELVLAAARTAQMSQIDKYKGAINAFRTKYEAFPGDIASSQAIKFSFLPRTGGAGRGDNNELIEGYSPSTGAMSTIQAAGETALFWADLASAKFIEGSFTSASSTLPTSDIKGGDVGAYFPKAKLGTNNYVYAWSGGKGVGNTVGRNGKNYLGVSAVNALLTSQIGFLSGARTVPVIDVWTIDEKMDDGFPMTGKIVALYLNYSIAPIWVNVSRDVDENAVATPLTTTTCIDNGGVAGAKYQYSLSNGSNANCGFSVQLY